MSNRHFFCCSQGAFWLLVILNLTACGFQFRQAVTLPPGVSPIFIQGRNGSPVREALVTQLQMAGVDITDDRRKAHLILRLHKESSDSRVLAVDRAGKALEYELHFDFSFDALNPDSSERIPEETLSITRNYYNPGTNVLGHEVEAELIRAGVAEDMAQRILMRLRLQLR